MKKSKLLCGLILLAGIAVSGLAAADPRHGGGRGYGGHGFGGHGYGHGGSSFGLYLGAPFPYDPFYYPYRSPYPYYAYPPVITVPAQPPVYIEQGNTQPNVQQAPVTDGNYYWYHCDNPEGYYPYVKQCPGGWERVTPTPPPQQEAPEQ